MKTNLSLVIAFAMLCMVSCSKNAPLMNPSQIEKVVSPSASLLFQIDSVNKIYSVSVTPEQRGHCLFVNDGDVELRPTMDGGCWDVVQKDVEGALSGAEIGSYWGLPGMAIGGLVVGAVSSYIEYKTEEQESKEEDDYVDYIINPSHHNNIWNWEGRVDPINPINHNQVLFSISSLSLSNVGQYHNYLVREMLLKDLTTQDEILNSLMNSDSIILAVCDEHVDNQLIYSNILKCNIDVDSLIVTDQLLYQEVMTVLSLYRQMSDVSREHYVQSLISIASNELSNPIEDEFAAKFMAAVSTMHASAKLWRPVVPEFQKEKSISIFFSDNINVYAMPIYDVNTGNLCRIFLYGDDVLTMENHMEKEGFVEISVEGVDDIYPYTINSDHSKACIFID